MSDSGMLSDNRSIDIKPGAVSGSAIISGNGNRVIIYHSQVEQTVVKDTTTITGEIGANPYKGLLAFQESDSNRYFGREEQIEKLWNLFRRLHENSIQPETPLRLLPILGPSGSGKSSLARAGLIPELAVRPIPGKSQARVAVLVPGSHPVEALATVLARMATLDPIPAAKTKEFEGLLKEASGGSYDGLRRIANVLPGISVSPLVILVDQFEEVYSLCKDKEERQIFIDNLIHAASDSAGYVSVIITLRSDFLGETQRHPALNQVIAARGVIVPAMSEDELRRAITKPAENAGHPLDEAVVALLLKDTEGREGALPLLQFALTRIWEGLKKGVEPVKTLENIGGVGGALAQEAQRIFDNLNDEEQKIARRVFLGLVQLGEGASDTRRRANVSSLVSYKEQPESVKRVIDRFANPGVRLVTVSSEQGIETAEVTHEALFANWGKMKEWLDSSRSDIRFGRRLEEAARIWEKNGRPEGSLWRPPDLDLLRKYELRARDNMAPLLLEFFNASKQAENNRKRLLRFGVIGLVSGFAITTITTLVAARQWQSAERGRVEQGTIVAKNMLSQYPVQGMVSAISLVGQSREPLLNFPNQSLLQSVKDALFSAVEISREKNLLEGHQGHVLSIAISRDGKTIVSGDTQGIIRMWNLEGQQIGQPFKGHQGRVISVAISRDGKTIVSGDTEGIIRMWNLEGRQIVQPFKGDQDRIDSVAISTDGKTIVSGGWDGTVRMWNREGRQIGQPFKGHQSWVQSVAISTDGKTIVSGHSDGTVTMWDQKGRQIGQPFKGHQGSVKSVAISTDGKTIVSGGEDWTVRMWNRNGQSLASPFKGHQGSVNSVAISTDGKTIVSGGEDWTVRMWNLKGKQINQLFKGHQGAVYSVAISTDGKTIFSGGDSTVRIWNPEGQKINQHFKSRRGKRGYVAISTDTKTIVSGDNDGIVRMWNREGRQIGQPFKAYQGQVSSVEISTNGQTIVSGDNDGTVRMWNREGRQIVQPFKAHQGRVQFIVISADGQTIVSVGDDGTVRMWNREGRQIGQPFKGHQGRVQFIVISADGQTIVSVGDDGTVRMWNREGRQIGQPFKGHQGEVYSVAISTDGKTIVSGHSDGTVTMWDQKGRQIGQPFKGHQGKVYSVAISTNGKTIVSGGEDWTVRMWNRNGQSLASPFKGHQREVYSVAISTDGQTIVSGGRDGTMRMWNREGRQIGQPFKGDDIGVVVSVAISTDGQTIASRSNFSNIMMWDIRLDSWLKIACERLRYHPVFKNPESNDEKEAKKTCEPYLRLVQKN
ncbi:WD-40 repeat-containing protein [Calothrix sp. NIES-4071]|nr:WD-40 repeat-containing protein [Calothrix sp. NIES-4071]BAZ54893.1 WD-40 repeat-containing protein [Calothrix sp. NIES-4105]